MPESAQDIVNKKQVIMNHVSDQIETLTKSSMDQLISEFQLLVAKFVKDKDLPEDGWGGNAAPEAMMRTALYSSAHVEGLKMKMGDEVIQKIYDTAMGTKAPSKKSASK